MVYLVSWNVNGIRAVHNKGFLESIKAMNPDVLCLQETKAHPEQVEHEMKSLGYEHEFWNSAEKKGYSGTAIFSKIKPITIEYGLGFEKHDTEGRVITVEFEEYYLVTVYTPNSKRGLERLDERTKEWDVLFLAKMKELEKSKPVIFCGDLNVAHTEQDIKNAQGNKTTKTKPGSAGFTDEERAGFDRIVEEGFIDTFRFMNPEEIKYSWWSYMGRARANNVGWRIDYFCASSSLKDKFIEATIHNEILGSDHCPVGLRLK